MENDGASKVRIVLGNEPNAALRIVVQICLWQI